MSVISPPGSSAASPLSGSENLFDFAARQAEQQAGAQRLDDLARKVGESLQGYVQRVDRFAPGGVDLPEKTAAAGRNESAGAGLPGAEQAGQSDAGLPGDSQMKEDRISRMVDSMARVFDYSIETQMVVRGATQVSGAASTLIKGQ